MKRVLVNGTFDGLHKGHKALFEFAKTFGALTVAIDSTERVKALKGSDRPFFELSFRLKCIAECPSVDNLEVFSCDEQLLAIVKRHDIMVKGSEYKHKPIIGGEDIKVIFFDEIVDTFGHKLSSSTLYQDFSSR